MTTSLRVAGEGSQHRVGGYILRSFLAQGGMAELYLAKPAHPPDSTQVVVVKRVLSQFAADAQFARMFAREAQLASMLKHPNIVEVFGSDGAESDECYFAMEYVHGPDLAEIMRVLKEGTEPIPMQHALTIAIGMAAGLHHAHAHRDETGSPLGIVHRDVSPSNVMISVDGDVKITDFGVAKALALTSFTQAGTRKGKLSYMSPEQAVADPVDRRTDIFAIGAVLFEMTTLERMFGGENELAVMHKLLFRERPRPSQFVNGYPRDLEQIIMQTVAQKPEDRFETAYDLQCALEDFAAEQGLRPDAAALGRWASSIIPPSPHPAANPSFFSAPAGSDLLAGKEQTTTDSVGSATFAENAFAPLPGTAVEPGPATAVGHVVAADSMSGHSAPIQLAPTGPGGVIVNPAVHVPPHPSAAHSSGYGVTTSKVGSAPRRRPRPFPVGLIIGGAVAVAAISLAAAFWYASHRDKPQSNTPAAADVTPAKPKPSPAASSERTTPVITSLPADPGTPVDAPIEIDVDVDVDDPPPPPIEPAVEPTAEPAPKNPVSSSRKQGRGKGRRQKRQPDAPKASEKPAVTPEPKPATPPKTAPPPPKTTKPKSDRLIPMGD